MPTHGPAHEPDATFPPFAHRLGVAPPLDGPPLPLRVSLEDDPAVSVVLETPPWGSGLDQALEGPSPTRNIDRFNLVTGEVFSRLYESFPLTAKLSASDLSREMGGDATPAVITGTVQWLEREGYLRIESMMGQNYSIHDTPIMDAVLTSKGLSVLQMTPESLKAKGETLGSALKEATQKGGKEAVAKLVERALSVGVSGLVRVAVEHGSSLLR